jgi:uncharacterized protein YkwD
MPRCDFCGKTISLPFHCQYCGKNFCDEHRLPPNHACAGLAEWKKTPAPGVGIRYGAGGASAYGGGYSTAPKGKKPGLLSPGRIPYLKIAAAVVALLIIVVLFILLGGCVQTAGANATAYAGATPATQAGTETPDVPDATTASPAVATASPVTTPTTDSTQVRVRPTVTTAQQTTGNPAVTANVTTTAALYATASTTSPPFTPVPGKLSDNPYTISTTSLADRIHELVNTHRAAYGLAPLSTDSALAAIALGHSTDMAVNNFFSHTNPAGQDPTARGTAAGYTCRKDYGSYYTYGIAENIFQNNLYTSVTYENGIYTYEWTSPEEIAQSTVTGWMNSEGHKKNILTTTYDREGIGVAIAADDKVYITEDFC